jgi:hypothetical protein
VTTAITRHADAKPALQIRSVRRGQRTEEPVISMPRYAGQ